MKPLSRLLPTLRAGLCAPCVSFAIGAAEFPIRPVTLLVPFAPGGSSEVVARVLGNSLSERWGKQLVVEHRPGGTGNIAMEAAARATPDGHVLIMGHIGTLAVNPAMQAGLRYDPLRDFAYVSLLATIPNVVVVHPSLPVRSVADLVEFARKRPGQLNYGSAGNGSGGHLAMEYLKSTLGIDLVHVPYKGTGQMVTDLLAGETQLAFVGVPPVMGYVKSGRLKPLVIGGSRRVALLPSVPTMAELGYHGFETSQWYGILAPAKTPEDVVSKLAFDIRTAMRRPDTEARLAAEGSTVIASGPQEFQEFVRGEMKRWRRVVQQANIRAE